MFRICLITFLLVSCLGSYPLSGQNSPFVFSPAQLQSNIPKSPEAAALGKFGALPVGPYTGAGSVEIPIYEVQVGNLKLPISVSYHASGIKVEEISSRIGAGWALSAGGSISRQTRGRPDESIYGFLEKGNEVMRLKNNQMTATERQTYLDEIAKGNIDAEPDIFNYSFPGGSGSFYYAADGSIISMPFSKNKIERFGNTWLITDTEGNQYFFEATETTTNSINTGGQLSSNIDGYFGPSITSIYLTRIVSNNLKDTISLIYDNFPYTFVSIGGQTIYINNNVNPSLNEACPCKDKTSPTYTNVVESKFLREIRFKNGKVLFNTASTQRLDLPGDFAIDNILVINTDSSYFKRTKFYNRYMIADGLPPGPYNTFYAEYYRLFLDSIKQFDLSNSEMARYAFEYNSGTLPKRTSFAQDHWGYSNGYNSNDISNLFHPTTTFQTAYNTNMVVNGAIRSASFSNSLIGTVNKITYPTGGWTLFNYEENKALSPSDFASSSQWMYYPIGAIEAVFYYSISFTLNKPTLVTFDLSTSGCGGGSQSLECPLVYLVNNTTNGQSPITSSYTGLLNPGAYTITADLSNVTDPNILQTFFVMASYLDTKQVNIDGTVLFEVSVGGVRVRKTEDFDQNGILKKSRIYDYNRPDTAITSGYLQTVPRYISDIREEIILQNVSGGTTLVPCDYKAISSSSNLPSLATKGSFVSYWHVKELFGEAGKYGINQYYLNSTRLYPDSYDENFPFPPSTTYDWRRGDVSKQNVLRKNGTGFTPVSTTSKNFIDTVQQYTWGVKVGTRRFVPSAPHIRDYEYTFYQTATGWNQLLSDTMITYDDADISKKSTSITNYTYNAKNYLPSRISTVNSRGEKLFTKIKYSIDFPTYAGSNVFGLGIERLKQRNLLLTPIEKIVAKQNGAANTYTVTGGQYFRYDTSSLNPVAISQLRQVPGYGDTSFLYFAGNSLVSSSFYDEKIQFQAYDGFGRLLQQRKVNDIPESYIWGYGNEYPIAKVTNSTASEIAYTSFEAEANGNWTIPSAARNIAFNRTGKLSYLLNSGSVSKGGLTVGRKMTLSYWSRTGTATITGATVDGTVTGKTVSGWTYYEHRLTMSSTQVSLSGSAQIDELRLYPQGSFMTSLTYVPLVGISSQSDPNSNTQFFFYDTIGRLIMIRDDEGNILKTIEYKLNQPAQ